MTATVLHASESIRVVDYCCTAEQHAKPFVEIHNSYGNNVEAVTYR